MIRTKPYALSLAASAVVMLVSMMSYVNMAPMNVLPYAYPMWVQAYETARTPADKPASLLILGDSRAKAGLIPALIDPNCVSLTLPGASPIDLYLLLREYLQTHPAPRYLLVAISPHHFHYPEIFWSNSVGFGFVESADFAEIQGIDAQHGNELLGSTLMAQVQYRFRTEHFPHLYAGAIARSVVEPRLEPNTRILNETRSSAGHHLFGEAAGSGQDAYETGRKDFVVTAVEDHYFNELLLLAQQHNIRTEFTLPPINQSSNGHIAREFREHFADYINATAAQYPAINFMHDWPVYNDSMFGDANHLNHTGAVRYSQAIRSRLENNLLKFAHTDVRALPPAL